MVSVLTSCLAATVLATASATAAPLPHFEPQGSTRQLIVDGRPFLILGGELGNSSGSDLAALKPRWADFSRMHLNTVLAPVSWELIEPAEGQFDWRSVDGLIADARSAGQRLVLLWFGSWKNSMSTYAPAWVRRDTRRFPRTVTPDGRSAEILSPLSAANLAADARAFVALMAHLRAVDAERRTVIMVQVENEVGLLPTARDHSLAAQAAFRQPVPPALTRYLAGHRDTMAPELRKNWEAAGARTSGDWPTVFGSGAAGEEVFTAWTLARYVDAVARAGKSAYPLPLYVNAALNRPGRAPGQYPSGGPVPHLLDVWKLAAPTIDLVAPDIYFPNVGEIAARYARPDNPLFVPETNYVGRPQTGSEALLAIGRYDAIGVSPFAIDGASSAEAEALGQAYAVLDQIAPLILQSRGLGRMTAFRPQVGYDGAIGDAPQTAVLGGYRLTAAFRAAGTPISAAQGALVIALGADEFLVAGRGVRFSFAPADEPQASAGLERVEEGRYKKGQWISGRVLNGDQSNQGRNLDLPSDHWDLQRVRLYRYR